MGHWQADAFKEEGWQTAGKIKIDEQHWCQKVQVGSEVMGLWKWEGRERCKQNEACMKQLRWNL